MVHGAIASSFDELVHFSLRSTGESNQNKFKVHGRVELVSIIQTGAFEDEPLLEAWRKAVYLVQKSRFTSLTLLASSKGRAATSSPEILRIHSIPEEGKALN